MGVLSFLRKEDFDTSTNTRGEARAYYRIPYEDFIDWSDTVGIQKLPIPWQVKTKVTIQADKKLASYLRDTKGTRAKNAFALAWRYAKAWPFTVAITVEGAFKIERLGWVPETVDVYLRALPRKKKVI